MTIEVIAPGMFTTIQDGGRIGMEAFGIPESGFLDQQSGKLANQLVGNVSWAALIEITGTGPTLLVQDDVTIAITGGDFTPSIAGIPLVLDTSVHIKKGSIINFQQAKTGFRCYLAFKGKLVADNVYNSFSTHVQNGFGGYQGRTLKKGDTLQVRAQSASVKRSKNLTNELLIKRKTISSKKHTLKIYPGPEFDLLGESEKNHFTKHLFIVSNNSNRMGYRLSGYWTLSTLELSTIISSGNIRGVVQLPPSLEPIILLNDAGTTGGYPRIGICENPDLVAQIKPGEKIHFEWIDYEL
jgi:antagonist of KipI